jgi:S1-C subfamily serine protease
VNKPDELPADLDGAAGVGVEEIYRYLLKSTAMIVNLVQLPNGHVAVTMASGALVDTTNRLVVTEYHVTGSSKQVAVFFPTYKDGKLVTTPETYFQQRHKEDGFWGNVILKDARVDMAVVQLDKLPAGLHALPFAAALPRPGSSVYSMGQPAGGSGRLWVYTEGRVRQTLHKQWKAGSGADGKFLDCEADVIMTDSPTKPGDSGGPLVNGRGELVGFVHGTVPGIDQMSLCIDLIELKVLLDRYAWTSGVKLHLEDRAAKVGQEKR